MPLTTLMISGPPDGGKSTLARLITTHVMKERPVHYLRLRQAADGHTNVVLPLERLEPPLLGSRMRSAHEVTYTSERAFETVPDGLREVRTLDRFGFTIIEADGDPALRHAYPYDFRVFVMPPPSELTEVFREPEAAARALHQVMQDTAAFASEIFGLFEGAGLDDSTGVFYYRSPASAPSEENLEQLDIRESQVNQFLDSPLGAEIASRIQLEPDYHGLVESDVVVVNTGINNRSRVLDECVQRIEKLLARVRHDTRRHSVLYWGDITDMQDPTHGRLLRRLRDLFWPEA